MTGTTTRILPRDEYARLAGTELDLLWPHFKPETEVHVVEDAAGAIIGCWSLVPIYAVEGLWVREDHRGQADVFLTLRGAMRRAMRRRGIQAVITGARNALIGALIRQSGGQMLADVDGTPVQYYALPVTAQDAEARDQLAASLIT